MTANEPALAYGCCKSYKCEGVAEYPLQVVASFNTFVLRKLFYSRVEAEAKHGTAVVSIFINGIAVVFFKSK